MVGGMRRKIKWLKTVCASGFSSGAVWRSVRVRRLISRHVSAPFSQKLKEFFVGFAVNIFTRVSG